MGRDLRFFRPYVGVTGFMTRQEIETLLNRVEEEAWGRHVMMAGVLVSSETMREMSNSLPGRYPPISEVAEIFLDHPRCLNLIHFNTKRPYELAQDMRDLMQLAGPNCHGFQLNIAWPLIDQLQAFRTDHPKARIVLQLGRRALDAAERNLIKIWERLTPYLQPKLVDDVLLDPSGGEGLPLDIREASRILSYLDETMWDSRLPHVRWGVAGGLRAERIPNLRPVRYAAYGPFNIDAEGQLRTPLDDPTNNQLDLMLAYAYLMSGLLLFRDWG